MEPTCRAVTSQEVVTNKSIKAQGRRGGCKQKKNSVGQYFQTQILKALYRKLFGLSKLPKEFADQAKSVRLNSTSCQVYIGLKRA